MDESDFAVHIIGLGLMGGSLAMALRSHVRRITASDLDTTVLHKALADGVIDAIDEIDQADTVILAIPANSIVELIQKLELRPGTLVIDLGSTKTTICEALDQLPAALHAVGGHPMCGLAENSYFNAIPNLYRGARFVLCETARTTPQARQKAEYLAKTIGATPIWMDRGRHDYLTALTSHLPHLLSFALMRLAVQESRQDDDLLALAAGGFDGATRLARTNETMITGMFTTNASNIRSLMDQLRQHIDSLESLFDDPEALAEELQQIVEARRLYSSSYGERPIA